MDDCILGIFTMACLVLLLGSLFTACGGAREETAAPPTQQETGAPEGKALVEERCTKCHGLERVRQYRKREAEWRATVERMVEKGAELDQAEQELVIKYLKETYTTTQPTVESATATPRLELPVAPVKGARAPDFTLTDLNGDEVSLNGLRGTVVLLNFWTTW